MPSSEKDTDPVPRQPNLRHSSSRKSLLFTSVVSALACAALLRWSPRLQDLVSRPSVSTIEEHECTPPLPQFPFKHRLLSSNVKVQKAARNVEEALTARFNEGGLDSVAVAVVTADGPVYEGFWGARRANETNENEKGTVNRDTVYRLASISKLFTTLETFILRDRGILNLDDNVDKYFPDLKFAQNDDPVTLRQLASHMSGLGRDWPPGPAAGAWPNSTEGAGPPWYNGLPFPNNEDFLKGISEIPLVAPPYTFPIYSNTGFSLLGLANVAANKATEGTGAPPTHAELLKRDIFKPLGLDGSSFAASEDNKANLAVSSVFSVESDLDFRDATNPAGGQMSSLSDLVKVMQILIDPTHPKSLLRPSTVREWMRPLQSFWDDFQEVGVMWEIFKVKDSFGRYSRQYTKFGELIGHHTVFTINPDSSFGVIILTTAPSMETIPLNQLVFSHFQAAFDSIAEEKTRETLEGTWSSSDRSVELAISLDMGSLYVSKYLINGTDVLKTIQPDGVSRRASLMSTGGQDLRLAISMPGTGCMFNWIGLDQYAYGNGYATNMLRVKQNADNVTILVPAISVELGRI